MDGLPPSTRDKDPEVQLSELREYAERRGFDMVAEFVDFTSGARNGRPEYQRMFDAAHKSPKSPGILPHLRVSRSPGKAINLAILQKDEILFLAQDLAYRPISFYNRNYPRVVRVGGCIELVPNKAQLLGQFSAYSIG